MSPIVESWRQEKRSAYLYRIIAQTEKIPSHQQLFSELAREAESQAQLWLAQAAKTDVPIPDHYRPELRANIVAWLIRKLGAANIRPILAASKIRGLSVYSSRQVAGFHPQPSTVEEVGASHRGASNNGGLRAAVFGVNDGLVSIICLVTGVAGAASNNETILLTGIAGLLAGAFSMSAGEYISMRSQREMFEYQIGLERDELAQYPAEEASELALIYAARGMPQHDAEMLAQRMIADPELGLDTLAREELGLNPEQLGSPWLAAFSSLLAFSAGGTVPLLPYLFGAQHHALPLAVTATALALFLVGATLSLFTGRNGLLGGLRMLLIGSAAGALTYAIGHVMGANLA